MLTWLIRQTRPRPDAKYRSTFIRQTVRRRRKPAWFVSATFHKPDRFPSALLSSIPSIRHRRSRVFQAWIGAVSRARLRPKPVKIGLAAQRRGTWTFNPCAWAEVAKRLEQVIVTKWWYARTTLACVAVAISCSGAGTGGQGTPRSPHRSSAAWSGVVSGHTVQLTGHPVRRAPLLVPTLPLHDASPGAGFPGRLAPELPATHTAIHHQRPSACGRWKQDNAAALDWLGK